MLSSVFLLIDSSKWLITIQCIKIRSSETSKIIQIFRARYVLEVYMNICVMLIQSNEWHVGVEIAYE